MTNKHDSRSTVALIYGGIGREREVSLSGKDYVLRLIDERRYRPLPIRIAEDGGWYLDDGSNTPTFPVRLGNERGFLINGKVTCVDCAFPLLHGEFGEDGRVQGLIECAGIRLVGADTLTGAVTSDKVYTKSIAEAMGIPTAEWLSLEQDTPVRDAVRIAEERLGYPMFIKPARLGSSIGAAAVHSAREFAAAFEGARLSNGGEILIEELIEDKREIEVAMLETSEGRIFSQPGEIVCKEVYDYKRKYDTVNGAATLARAELSETVALRIREYCDKLARGLSLRGLARIDFFLAGERIIFNEINTMPGFTPTSLYARMMSELGIPPRVLIGALIESAEAAI